MELNVDTDHASSTIDVKERFRTEFADSGLNPPEYIQADGLLHRFSTNGKSHNSAGWYVLHLDTIPAGAYGCWRSDISEKWCSKSPMTEAEQRGYRKRMDAIKAQKQIEQTKRHSEAKEKAVKIWGESEVVDVHPYLSSKGVKSNGIRRLKDSLVIPIRDSSVVIHSLQFIDEAGNKKFLTGGAISGNYCAIGKLDKKLLICEGFATGASLLEATGHAVAVAFNAGNLKPVAEQIRSKHPEIEIVVCGDNDEWTDGNPGPTKAKEAAQAVRGLIAIPTFKDTTTHPTDFNDLHQLEGLGAVKSQLEKENSMELAGANDPGTRANLIEDLAALPPEELTKTKLKESANALDLTITDLRQAIDQKRPAVNADAPGRTVEFDEVTPWLEPVDCLAMLNEIQRHVREYVRLSEHGLIAVTLWIVFTYLHGQATVSPIAAITSPQKRCGKTTLITLLSMLCWRALPTNNITAAALFRTVDKYAPSLLIDEADTYLTGKENNELRGIINSGHTKRAAFVIRTVGDQHDPARFTTWAPKAIAMIGKLPDTIQDRSIEIRLERKKTDEKVVRLRPRDDQSFVTLQRKILRWAEDYAEYFEAAGPTIPEKLHDRAADNWEPLLAIADLAGGDWAHKSRMAALALTSIEDDSAEVLLLEDCKQLFESHEYYRIGTKPARSEQPFLNMTRDSHASRRKRKRPGEFTLSLADHVCTGEGNHHAGLE